MKPTPQQAQEQDARQTVWWLIGLLGIMAVGAWFRLIRLGEPAFRADTLIFWNVCQQPISWIQIVADWLKIMGISSGQFPFPLALVKGFLAVFHLPVTHFTVRLPSALWGIATIPVMYAVGKALVDRRVGLLLAAWLAVNAFHIQVTREAYFYPPLVLGACLAFLGAIRAVQRLQRPEQAVSVSYVIVNVAGFALMTYSQPTGWPMAFLCVVVVAGVEAWLWFRKNIRPKNILIMGVAYLVLGLPLLVCSWGFRQLLQISSGSIKEASQKAFAVSTDSIGSMLERTMTSFVIGSTPVRLALTLALVIVAVIALCLNVRRRWEYLLFPWLLIGGFLLFLVSRQQASAMFEARYIVGLLPVFLALLAVGLAEVGELAGASKPPWIKSSVVYGLGIVVLAFSLYPAYVSTWLTGKPTPYKMIVAWTDSHLPKGTPVLVDRWFEPWNELKIYPSTNVYFTFTIPNEPVDVFLKYHWRDTATNFFNRYPDAAYLEIAKEYWTVPEVGPWQWPRDYFARRVVFTNEAGLKLRQLGVAGRVDYCAANTNRVIVELFYNLPDDIASRCRQMGQPASAWFGKGWGYVKTQDYRDWRVLESKADVTIANLAEVPRDIEVSLYAVAVGGNKLVQGVSSDQWSFEKEKMMRAQWVVKSLPPGLHAYVLRDPSWDKARVPLLVERVECKVLTP